MSEFSSGIMIQTCHKENVLKYMEKNTYLIQLNDLWLCRLSESDLCNHISEADYSEAVLNLSEHIPLMHIVNAEDHGFELGILHRKKLAFTFGINYGVESEFVFQLGQQLYGEEYMDRLFDDEVMKNIERETQKHSAEVEERIQSFFSGIGAEQIKQFQLFGFQQDVCERIQHILTYPNYQKDKLGYRMIRELYAAIGIDEFCFVSHYYISKNEENFIIVR
ncbi:hypothetical protein [Lacrimispora brassicae]